MASFAQDSAAPGLPLAVGWVWSMQDGLWSQWFPGLSPGLPAPLPRTLWTWTFHPRMFFSRLSSEQSFTMATI